jgi:hypothetical protein
MGILGSWKMARAQTQIIPVDCVREFLAFTSSKLRGLSMDSWEGCLYGDYAMYVRKLFPTNVSDVHILCHFRRL